VVAALEQPVALADPAIRTALRQAALRAVVAAVPVNSGVVSVRARWGPEPLDSEQARSAPEATDRARAEQASVPVKALA
jgi:hypothetical protein